MDIDSSAVDIAKLRFWLSLIVDEEDIKIIKPLPNLDHKIMCGNSLLEEFEGVKLFDEKLLIEIPKDYSYQLEQIDREVNKLNQELHDIHTGKKADNGTRTKQIQRELRDLKREKEQILSGPNEDVPQVTLDEALQKRIKESQKKLNELKELQKKFFNEQNRKLKRQYAEEIDRIEWELIEETLKEEGNEEAMQKLEQYKKKKSKPFFLWKLYFSEVFQRDNPGFDVVIANPPYVVLSPEELKGFTFTKGNNNTYVAFLEIAKRYSNSKSTTSYIIPTTWMAGNHFRILRVELLKNNSIQQIIQLPYDIFSAYVDSVILIINGDNIRNKFVKTFKFRIRDAVDRNIKFEYFDIDEWKKSEDLLIFLDIRFVKILDKYRELKSKRLSDIAKVQRGTLPPKKHEEIPLEIHITGNRFLIPWFSHQVYRYEIRKNEIFYVDYDKLRENKPVELFKCKKILGRQLISRQFRLQFSYFDQISAFKKNLYAIYNIKKTFHYFYILAILNSKFYSYIQVNLNVSGQRDDYPSFSLKDYRNFLIPEIRFKSQEPFVRCVDQILSITKSDDYLDNPDKQAKVKKLEEEIDKLVYELYELTPEAIEIVEAFNGGK